MPTPELRGNNAVMPASIPSQRKAAPDRVRLHLCCEPELYRQIVAFRRSQRYGTRTEAVLALIRAGLLASRQPDAHFTWPRRLIPYAGADAAEKGL